MNELPSNWIAKCLVDIAQVEMGQSPDSQFYNSQGEGLPFFQGKAEFGVLYPIVRKWCTKPTKVAEAGDILLSIRAPIGPTNLAKEQCCIGRGLAAIRTISPISQKYLLHYFRHIESWLANQGTGSTFTAISGGFLRKLEVPLAPLNEQKRIADKLDALLARVDACRARLDRIPAILKRFRQAVLAAATSGKLTETWRKNRGLTLESWLTKTGREVFPFVTSGSRGWAAYYADTGARFLRVGNLDHNTIDLDLHEIQHVNLPNNVEGRRTRIAIGDILISITADIGMVGYVREDLGESYINQHLCLARQSGEHLGAYLAYFLASPVGGLAQMTDVQRGATKAGLTLEDIKALAIQLPLKDEQEEIVRHVETLFAYADRIEARYTAARTQVEKLTPALLAKAFRGELVPQDPNDEPASVLLERIRAAAHAPTKKRNRSKAVNMATGS